MGCSGIATINAVFRGKVTFLLVVAPFLHPRVASDIFATLCHIFTQSNLFAIFERKGTPYH